MCIRLIHRLSPAAKTQDKVKPPLSLLDYKLPCTTQWLNAVTATSLSEMANELQEKIRLDVFNGNSFKSHVVFFKISIILRITFNNSFQDNVHYI